MFRVYLVADRSICAGDHTRAVDAALAGLPRGAAAVQLRDKEAGGAALLAQARALRPVCLRHGAPLLVNDRADVALATGAAGVHLPAAGLPPDEARRLLGPRALIGASCHSLEELRAAARAGADFAVYGPVWATPGKGAPVGLDALGEAAREVRLPVFALGGVDAGNAAEALRAGARGVACIRSVLGAADPRRAAEELWRALQAGGAA